MNGITILSTVTPIKEIPGKYEIMDIDKDLYKLRIIEKEETE